MRQEFRFSPITTHVDLGTAVDPSREEQYYSHIEKAITTCRSLKLSYDSIASGLTERMVDPYFILFKGRAFYFVGWCHLRKEFRTFRTERIAALSISDDTFVRNSDLGPQEYFNGSWSVYSGDPVEVVVRFRGAAAKVVLTARHHPDEKIEPDGEGIVIYSVVTRGIEEIQRWILGFGEEAEVIRPDKLRSQLSQLGRYLNDCYD